ncbi:protein bark beetle isoform X2 [Nasonia vitripennis]|uniref:SRCR domain-containing protein n=1 Tax=Nasonia vitripennis TaxID=7425 RepID=A0A7M7QBW8_NASVI|nr:protein bark beetle isoform X2 [Nasonia vitripennis]
MRKTMMPRLLWLLLPLLGARGLLAAALQETTESSSIYYTEPNYASSNSVESGYRGLTELPGGKIVRGRRLLERAKSPYVLREDLFVERDAELSIEAGVEVRFAPMIGITVRGVLLAEGEESQPIVLTGAEGPSGRAEPRLVRLVDGPSPLEGRLQILHKGEWRSVCSNSRNWTRADLETACRELGYQGGRWWSWMDRQWPARPRLLYEQPQCRGTEASLQNCGRWSQRALGAGVCDYHPDLGISCSPFHDGATAAIKHWRGLRFEQALYDRPLIQENTLYVRRSKSILKFVEIRHAGTGRDFNVTSALHVEGVPPRMESISIIGSSFTGINVTIPDAPIVIDNCTIQSNKGYGIYMNSSTGLAHIHNCVIVGNGADGVKYVHHDERPDDKPDRADVYDLCTFPTTASQTFPVTISVGQSKYAPNQKRCPQHIFTRPGHVLTVHFLQMKTDRNDSAVIEVYDGIGTGEKLLARVKVRNGTLPQSVTTSRQNLYIKFFAEPRTSMVAFLRLTSGYKKTYDLNVTGSTIADNSGRGIAAEKLRSALHIDNTAVSNNRHVAGVHVLGGVPEVNVTGSRIAFNRGDGINITVTGGSRNVSRSSISSNRGYGFAVWLNDSSSTEYVPFNQTTVVEYSEIFRNQDIGILVGNSTGNSYVNVTGNWFNSSSETAVQIESSWRYNQNKLKLRIGHNMFVQNAKLGIKLSPALNVDGVIEYNHFREHTYGGILVRNPLLEEFNVLPADLLIQHNEFYDNKGFFVASLGLSPYSDVQRLLFTRNFLRDNRVREPFDNGDIQGSSLIPRSRVSAVVVVSSSNVHIFRNILHNPESNYEIGSHLEDQSKIINCTYNWLGSGEQPEIFERLFHRKDRYNLAKIEYMPYLLHSSNPATNTINPNPTFVPRFLAPGTNIVGGEVDGQETLQAGEYIVKRDINVRPGGKLILQPGVTLRFPPAVGIMVAGKLDAHGTKPSNILMTLKEEIVVSADNETVMEEMMMGDNAEPMMEMPVVPEVSKVPVRLLGGKTSHEGRLQVRVGEKWGTVCNYGWTMRDAALVCHQLGLTLDPDNWYMERNQIPSAGTNEDIILSNVQCTEDDIDVSRCKAETMDEFENSCTHENDVGVRCTEAAWAGLRLGPLALRSDLQYITIEKAGLLDYTTNSFKPALQMDFARHSLEGVKVVNNLQDGLGVLYSDIYSADAVNTVRNSDFSNNKGSGISFKQLGLRITNSRLKDNKIAGIRHNPAFSAVQQRELAGWFISSPDTSLDSTYDPVLVPEHSADIELAMGETKYLVTSKVSGEAIDRYHHIRCTPGYVVGIQLLNPIQNRSTEQIILHDSQNIKHRGNIWHVKRDLTVFPVTSSSYIVVFEYHSGDNALGGTVIVLTALPAPLQDIKNRIVRGPIPTLRVFKSEIRGNKQGVLASYYNRYLDECGDHYLRKANESIQLINCEISHNYEEAIFVNSPHWNVFNSNISEISIHINNTLITDNGRGIIQYSRDMRQSNNLFHWVIKDSTIERNQAGGFEVALPYVWQYNENFTHSIYMDNNTWQANEQFGFVVDGHFATFNMSRNRFDGNRCKTGLISVRGMEKRMKIEANKIERNSGSFMVEFKADSQSEIMGDIDARFMFNEVKGNNKGIVASRGFHQMFDSPTYVVGFHGIQKVRVNRNLFGENSLDYELLAGIKTAKINNKVDVTENWWGTGQDLQIRQRIFDFDDWNDHAVADFRPYLTTDSLDSSISASYEPITQVDLNNLGGRIVDNLSLYPRAEPYVIRSDITVMPDATLYIHPDVVMEFAPNVGILVLGTLKAVGAPGHEIVMRPISDGNEVPMTKKRNVDVETIRLCKEENCTSSTNEGFVEYFNRTTLQWIPLCDTRFTERNAQVACRQLGFEPLNVYVSKDRRYELHPGSLSRIWSWPEPLQCTGNEERLEECQIRLNGQLFGHRYECPWDGQFVFLHCGQRNLDSALNYWGGIRIANSEFEHYLYEYRIHDVITHETLRRVESVLKYVNITGAGILHNERSPAVQSIMKSPSVTRVSVNQSAYHGINVISPTHTIELLFNQVKDVFGNGINVLSLTGEGREAEESSFSPLKDLNIPYHLFSIVDICDTTKEVTIEERVLIYYKYDNNPVNCVKIFRSSHRAKPFGFRLLQFNLFNSTGKPGRPDSLTLYDGDIYNVTVKKIDELYANSPLEKKLFRTEGPSLSVKLFATGASNVHGFIAEVVTLPISAIGFNRDVQHNISYSVISKCQEGAVKYSSAGEVNAVITLERNQFVGNCEKLYGNFSTCGAAVSLDIQNTQSVYFRNNLVMKNQGGLRIRADSRGSATSLKGWIHNNLFNENYNKPALYVEGRQSSPYQEVTIFRNYFTKNNASFENNIVLKQVVSNMTLNYLHGNLGKHLLEISGFERVRLPIYQSTSHNGFYKNYAVDREGRSTIVAGTPGQQYVDNIFFNPDNDYEMLTINRSLQLEMWRSSVDARHNYWGYNETLAVAGRIRDRGDSPELLQVEFQPYHMNNQSVLTGKCPPAWDLVGDTCYIYIGAPMDFFAARDFCRSANASMPFIMGDYIELWKFLKKQQERFDYSERVWIQQIEKVDQCTMFTYQTTEIDHCGQPNPFICEIDPRIYIDPLSWRKDIVAVGVLSAIAVALLLLAAAIALWVSKSKKRQVERLERRNSIRQSLHSLRSVGSTSGFSELAYQRRKPIATKQSTDTLNSRSLDYKKMSNGGSLDSMDKSQLNSSLEDNQCYDVYEAHNPRYSPGTSSGVTGQKFAGDNPAYDLTYRNEGFRNHSTFTSRNNSAWQSEANSVAAPEELATPSSEHVDVSSGYLHNVSTLPLNSSLGTSDSISELKRDLRTTNSSIDYDNVAVHNGMNGAGSHYDNSPVTPGSEPVPEYFSSHHSAATLPHPHHHSNHHNYYYEDRPRSEALLETNLDEDRPLRSKSEAILETNFDAFTPNEPTELTQLSTAGRSKSQPLETAM